MDYYGSEINKLIDQLETLPGIGRKSAQRLAFHVIHMPEENVKALSEALISARRMLHADRREDLPDLREPEERPQGHHGRGDHKRPRGL